MSKLLNRVICWSHFGVGFVWVGLFFVPTSWWPDRVAFHFFFSATIIGQQVAWGAFIKLRTGKFRPACFLTTITQYMRGFSVSSPENYDYSFTREIFQKIGIPFPSLLGRVLAGVIFMTVAIQYFFIGA